MLLWMSSVSEDGPGSSLGDGLALVAAYVNQLVTGARDSG